jgi:hypothetical protein
LTPPPRNFTQAQSWKNGTRLEDIYRTLEQGIKGSAMVSYNYLSRRDRMALAHYVQSLGAFEHGASDPAARAALEKQFSGSAEVIPNRIPVREAVRHLVEEFGAPSEPVACSNHSAIVDPGRVSLTGRGLGSREPAEIARRIALGAPGNGFSVAVDTYSASQWNQLMLCLAPR